MGLNRVQKSLSKEVYIQLLKESDDYPITTRMCKLTSTRKVSVYVAAGHDPSLYDRRFA